MESAQAQQSLQATFSELRKLSIRLLKALGDSRHNTQSSQNLHLFLEATRTIEELSLIFEAGVSGIETAKEKAATDMLLSQDWPKLRRLDIDWFRCTEKRLVSFVDRNASNLDVLTVRDLKLQTLQATSRSL